MRKFEHSLLKLMSSDHHEPHGGEKPYYLYVKRIVYHVIHTNGGEQPYFSYVIRFVYHVIHTNLYLMLLFSTGKMTVVTHHGVYSVPGWEHRYIESLLKFLKTEDNRYHVYGDRTPRYDGPIQGIETLCGVSQVPCVIKVVLYVICFDGISIGTYISLSTKCVYRGCTNKQDSINVYHCSFLNSVLMSSRISSTPEQHGSVDNLNRLVNVFRLKTVAQERISLKTRWKESPK